MKHIYEAIIVPASVLMPVSAGLVKTVYKDQPSKTILLYLLFAGVTDVVERILGTHHINNLPLLHFYTIVEYLFILRYFQLILNDQKTSKLITLMLILFPVFSILDFIFIQDIHQYNSYPRPIAAIIIIMLCMYYFFRYNDIEVKRPWSAVYLNWITFGLLIYFCSSLLYFAFINVIYHLSLSAYFIFGAIHATLVLLMYLLFTAGFLRVKE
jgi:hypothetical protein